MQKNQWTRLGMAAVVAGTGLLAGCGDNLDMKMQRAKLAMTSEKFQQATEYAESVLKEQPENREAVEILAKAKMRLQRLDESRKSIDALLKADPSRADSHKLMTEWCFFQMAHLLSQSGFVTDTKLQTKFDQAMETGQREADWFQANEPTAANAKFLRARFAEADATRLNILLRAKSADLKNVDLDKGDPGKQADEATAKLKAAVADKYKEADVHLRGVLEIDPRHFEAAGMYARLLSSQQGWEDLWALAQRMSKEKDIPVSLYDRLVNSILRMPESVQTVKARIETGWALQSAVVKSGQDSPLWKKATANLHLLAEEPTKAQPLAEQLVKQRPGDAEARLLLAKCFVAQDKYPEAKVLLDKLATEMKDSSQVNTLYGMTLLRLNEVKLAKDVLRRAIDRNPEDVVARQLLVTAIASEGQLDVASRELESLYQANPSDPKAIRFKLQYEKMNSRPASVREVLERVEKLQPLLDEHVVLMIEGYTYLQEYGKAENFAKELVRRRPDSIDGYLRLAETRLMQGKDDEVRANLVELKKKFANAAGVDQMLGKLFLQRQSYDKAVELLEGVVKNEPRNTEARVLLATALMSLSMTDEAMEHINRVLEQSPGDVGAHAVAARLYQITGHTDKSSEHLSQIDSSKVDERTNPTLLAQIKMRLGDNDEAAAICNRAVAAGNSDPTLRLMLANIYLRKGERDQAEQNLLGLVRSQPNNLQAYALLNRFYVDTKLFDKGINALTNLQTLNDTLPIVAQAQLLAASERTAEAIERLKIAYPLALKRRDRVALSVADTLARIFVQRKDYASATEAYEPLRKANLFPIEVSLRQIDLSMPKDGEQATAAKLEALAAKLTPEQSQLRYQVLRRFIAIRQYPPAVKLLDTWIDAQPKEYTLHRWKGELLMEMGDGARAVEALKQAVALAPEESILRLRLAQAHVQNLDYPAAEATLLDASKLDSGAAVASYSALGQLFLGLGLNRQAALTYEKIERLGRQTDPRVLFATGQAYYLLNRDEQASKRLGEVPKYAPQYPSAQVILARIEQRTGKAGGAKARLEELAKEPRNIMMASRELLNLNIQQNQDEELIRWTDSILNVEKLPDVTRAAWLRVRAQISANRADWGGVLAANDQIAKNEPQNPRLAEQRLVLLLRLRRANEAKVVYNAFQKLPDSPASLLLATMMGEAPTPPKTPMPVAEFIAAMAKGDAAAAKSAAGNVPPMRTVFKADLIALADRPDSASPESTNAYAVLGLALCAQHAGLPHLAAELAQDVINKAGYNTLAHGILVQANIDNGKPIDAVLTRIRQSAPTSALALFVSARQKTTDRDFAGAVTDYMAVLEKDPGNPHVTYLMTNTAQRAGKVDLALDHLAKLIQPGQEYTIAATNDWAYLTAVNRKDQIDKAQAVAQTALKQAPDFTPLLDTVGWIEHLRGNSKAALIPIGKAVTALGNVPEVQYHMGAVYKAVGNKEWAGYFLDQAAAGPENEPGVADAKALMGK